MTLTGKLGSLDPTYKKEYADALIWQLDSGNNAAFPARVNVSARRISTSLRPRGNAAGDDPIETDPSGLNLMVA
jgi:hypothetical protein